MKIVLICAQGMSTSMLVQSMYQSAEEGDVIEAVSAGIIEQVIDNYDIVLLGPQIRYKLGEMKELANVHNKIVDMIDMRAYGQMNGKLVYQQAKKLLKK